MASPKTLTPEGRARQRAKYFAGVMWHVGAFVIINGFFWILDMFTGASGVQWAYWISIFWSIALAFHVLAYFVAGSRLEERKTKEFLAEELEKERQLS